MKRLISIALITIIALSTSCVSTTPKEKTQLLVIGGSTSGTAAAIAAARGGVNTIIVEPTPMLGGMITSQGVSVIDGNHNLWSGIWYEFRDNLRNHYGGEGALFTGWVSTTLFEPHIADSIFKAMVAAEPNIKVIYGYHPTKAIVKGNRVEGAIFEDLEGNTLTVNSQLTMDATDLGDFLPLCGAAYDLGMDSRSQTNEPLAHLEANDVVQDLTLVATLKDYGEAGAKRIEKPEGYDPEEFKMCRTLKGGDTISAQYMLDYGRMPNNKFMINWPLSGNDIFLDVVELPFKEREKALEPARQKTLRFAYYIQNELGLHNIGIADDEYNTKDGLAYAPYHREGRRVQGVTRMTLNDAQERYSQSSKLYRVGGSVGDYPVDHHHLCHPTQPDIDFPPIPSFSVPLGSLVPKSIDNLIVSDKAISVSNLMNGSSRLQPVVMLTGQAAGTLAAVAVNNKCQPRNVNIRTVQDQLLDDNAYITPLFDVKPSDPDFKTLQRAAATGVLKMVGEPYPWANRSWIYPERSITEMELIEGLQDYAKQKIEIDGKGDKELTALRTAQILAMADASIQVDASLDNTAPITRREVARMVDKMLNPFAQEIDFEGNIIK